MKIAGVMFLVARGNPQTLVHNANPAKSHNILLKKNPVDLESAAAVGVPQ